MNKIYKVYTCETDLIKSADLELIKSMQFHQQIKYLDLDSLHKHGWSFYGASDWLGIKNGWVIWEEDKFDIKDIYTMLVVYPKNRLGSPDKEFVYNFKKVLRYEKIESLGL